MLTLTATFSQRLYMSPARASASRELIVLESPLETCSDSELARRIGRGERWAEEAFYRRHIAQVVALAQRLLGNSADAEDVAQETFVTAFAIWNQLRDHERVRAWLLQITVRKVYRVLRKRRLLRLFGLDRSIDDLPLDALAREDLASEARSDLMVLDALLKRVPPNQKIPWMLRHVEAMPLDEIAEKCACSLATAKRRIAAVQALVERQLELEVSDD